MPGIDQGLDRIIDHGLVVNRQEMLIGDASKGIESAAGSAR